MDRQNLAVLNEPGPGDATRAFGRPLVIAASAFAAGVIAGMYMKGAATWAGRGVRRSLWRRQYDRTVTYDENLPDSLGRREPAPHPGQPRFGGTGAIGVSPVSGGARPKSNAD